MVAEENEQDKQAEKLFTGLVTEAGSREVEIEHDEVHKSRSESEAEPSNLSDLQAALHKMFPKFAIRLINRVAQALMVSRIATDVFLDLVYLTVTDVVEMWDEEVDGDLDVQEVITLSYAACSIGIDGKGRADVQVIVANVTESKEASSLGNALRE